MFFHPPQIPLTIPHPNQQVRQDIHIVDEGIIRTWVVIFLEADITDSGKPFGTHIEKMVCCLQA